MTNLQTVTVKELKEIAKSYGIALSFTQDGKRHALNKTELIAAIEAAQSETAQEAVETTLTTVTNDILKTFIESVVNKSEQIKQLAEKANKSDQPEEKEITLLSLSEVVPFATNKLKEITCIKELQQFKRKLLATFNDKQQTRKRTLKAKWAMQYNRLTMLFAQYERKLATSN